MSKVNFVVGDYINGVLETFDNREEAEECFKDYVAEGNKINAENAKELIDTDPLGNDIYPEFEDASTFYFIKEVEVETEELEE